MGLDNARIHRTGSVCLCTLAALFTCFAAPAAGDPMVERARRQMQAGKPPETRPPETKPPEARPPQHQPEPRDDMDGPLLKDDLAEAREAAEQQRQERVAERDAKAREKLDPAVREAARLLDDGKHAEAYAILREVRIRLRGPDVTVETLAAKVALAEKRPDKALEFISPVAPQISREALYDPGTFDTLYTFAQAHLHAASADVAVGQSRSHQNATGNSFFGIAIDDDSDDPAPVPPTPEQVKQRHAEEARRVFDLLAYHSSRHERAYDIHVVLAVEGYARAMLALNPSRPGEAVKAYEFAIARARASEALFDESGKLDPFLKRLRDGLDKARYAFDIERYGRAFVRYRDAERHRRQTKQYDKALEIYAEIAKEFTDTIWADAAGFYTAQCHLDKGDPRMAAQLWRRFIDADPRGLYRGEALIRLADLALEHDLNPRRAVERYQQAIDWLAAIEEHDKTADMKRVEERARQVSAAAREKYAHDDWGNVVVADNRVGALINRATTPWYLDHLRYEAHLKLGMCHSATGDGDKAAEAFAKLRDFDKRILEDEKKIWGSTAQRPIKAATSRQGPRGENDYLRVFQGQRRTAAYLGNLHYDALEWDKARTIYQRLLDHKLGPLTLEEEAYCVYLLGNIEHMAGNAKHSIEHLMAFETEEKYARTPIAAKALYTYGAIACQYRMDDDKYDAIWQRVLPLVVKRYPNSPEAEHALFYAGFAIFHLGDIEEAEKYFREYIQRYKVGRFRKIIESHLIEMRNAQ
jgi:tetratricopeptide (TPR) repeat protein